jgi:lipid-A-disaccharide synthase
MNQDLLMVVAGEASADSHAAALVRELRALRPGLCVFGVGGAALKAAGAEILFDFSRTGVVGIAELWPQLGRFYQAYRRLLQSVAERKPRGVVLLDLPDFNLLLAKKIRRLAPDTTIIYYISPQVWAWRAGRVKTIAQRAHVMLTLFPFEAEIYRRTGMDVEFVGHPLKDLARPSRPAGELRREFGVEGAHPVIAVLPGSRRAEVERYLPVMASAAVRLKAERPEAEFLLAQAPTLSSGLIRRCLPPAQDIIRVMEARVYDVLAVSDLAMAGSGTVTLEAALMDVPVVVLAAVSWLSWVVGKLLVKVDMFSLPNVLAGQPIVPELVQHEARPQRLYEEVKRLLEHPEKTATIKKEFARVRDLLGEGGASARAARAVHRRLWGVETGANT